MYVSDLLVCVTRNGWVVRMLLGRLFFLAHVTRLVVSVARNIGLKNDL